MREGDQIPSILITGASGYLAHRLVPIASEFAVSPGHVPNQIWGTAYTSYGVSAPAQIKKLDITDRISVHKLVSELRPDTIIHAAALNPGVNESMMDAVNHQGTHHIATAAAKNGSRLVCVSTDVVHNGREAPYADAAPADALNTYGRSKALGEQAVLDAYPQAVIARTSLIYGLDVMDRGTAGFVERLGEGQQLTLFDNVLRQPVWIDSLAVALCRLALEFVEESGLINLVGDQVMSRADFGVRLLRHWGVTTDCNVSSVSVANSGAADRLEDDDSVRIIEDLPIDLRMSCHRAAALGIRLPGIDAVLAAQEPTSLLS